MFHQGLRSTGLVGSGPLRLRHIRLNRTAFASDSVRVVVLVDGVSLG